MPLYKKKPFQLVERPDDLLPNELVYQVRYTKEIFRDYGEYLNRINLYRQRVWTCKVTGKMNLSFEEALVSEKQASEKVQQFPKELVAPVLRDVQFSMLTLKDLVNSIASKISPKLQEYLSEGTELYGKRNNRIYPCKIVKVIEKDVKETQYEVVWLGKNKKITGNAVVNGEDLVQEKLPFSRDFLKSFIRESTYRSAPWVLHDKLAKKHGISTDPPKELESRFIIQNGHIVSNRKRSRNEEDGQDSREGRKEENRNHKQKKVGQENSGILPTEDDAEDRPKAEPIKYPIDDLLVQPAADDPVFTERPSPSRDFIVPMDCVGDVLLVWEFCSSFGRLLQLSPFSLEDFQGALCHKDSNVVLIVESHSAILRLLIKDDGDYATVLQKKKRKPKITLVTWREYLCDFLEMIGAADLSTNISTIRRGHYGLLDIHAKLRILRELVTQAIMTNLFREKIDEYIEERQVLAAENRERAIEEGRKKREVKDLQKQELDDKETIKGRKVEPVGNSSKVLANGHHSLKKRDYTDKKNEIVLSPQGNHKSNSRKQPGNKVGGNGKEKLDEEAESNTVEDSSRKATPKRKMEDRNEVVVNLSGEQRKEYFEQEIAKRFIRTNPLGKDREHNRYWFFRRDGRMFIESSDSIEWGYYATKEELDTFMGSLNPKGERERALEKQLQKHYSRISSGLQRRSKEAARNAASEEAVRRSSRVRAPPRKNPALAFLEYSNKWKED